MNIDFTNLNDIYHLSMIVVGVGGLILAYLTFRYHTKGKKNGNYPKQQRYYRKKK